MKSLKSKITRSHRTHNHKPIPIPQSSNPQLQVQTQNSLQHQYQYQQQQQKFTNNIQLTCMLGAIIVALIVFYLQIVFEYQDRQIYYNSKVNQNIKQGREAVKKEISDLKQENRVNGQNIKKSNIVNREIGAEILENWEWGGKYPLNSNNIKNAQNKPPVIAPPEPTKRSVPNTAMIRSHLNLTQLDQSKKFKQLKNQPSTSLLSQQQFKYYQQKYNISNYAQLPFCIVIPSYNNNANDRIINNINSILQQNYKNYHVVFIDDASDDGTGVVMGKYVQEHRISEKKLKVIINQNRTMAMPNIYRAAKQQCKPYQIFIIVDGDDQIIGKQVLKHFNMLFQSNDIWVAYSNFITVRGSIGYSRPYSDIVIEKNTFRKAGFVISHLRAFYAKLLTLVREQDLQDQNKQWFRAANDVAMFLPILQMAHKHLLYCPQISYLYNSNTGLNNHKTKLKEQKGNQKKIKQKNPYQPLIQLFTTQQKQALKQSIGNKIQIKDKNMKEVEGVVQQGWEK